MTPSPPEIGLFELLLALVFVLAAQLTSLFFRLGLGRDIVVGTLRTFAQLFLMGYALKFIFQVEISWLSIAVFVAMITTAAHVIRGRVKERSVPFVLPMYVSMFLSYFVVSVIVSGLVIGADPWWTPRYFIPIAGMIVGNSMSAVAIGLERLFADLRTRRDIVEMKLCMGADFREASEDVVRDSIRAGMIPTINSMMGVGLVFIPGMMTGQILAGADPLIAIRYQIVVMLMLMASTAMGSLLVVLLARKRCFGTGQQLILPRD
ncbi:MAG: ABC transporter permease [Desulfovibrionales bacterium]